MQPGDTDKRVTAWFNDFLRREEEDYGVAGVSPFSPPFHAAAAKGMITKSALARAAGESVPWISRRLSGDLPWPTATLDKIAERLGVTTFDIQRGPKAAA